ncbi:MAG TPA: isoleucine--tRNA ligase [Gemmatimonadales bacterium]|jgi:isoleucyl-tRNA synthetase|nr:isoleucine--tRNA ligase [Gemmatimonadales bacterium]
MAYPPLDPSQSADALEKQLLATWKHERLFARVTEATRYGPRFVFYEGPPTANGRPGIHHVFSRTLKDLICRYHTMLGQGVTRIAGWDTHGLPVEIEVEKALNISGKKDIEAFGVERFNALCKESVFRYKADWEAMSDRIGYWLDYEHPYITYSNPYIETVWWLLKRLHEKALLYRGYKVLPYCPRCGTALSSHEVAQGYESVQTNSVYVTFPLESDGARQLVIWTTTPWTLVSNIAVAVHPDLEYGEWAVDGVRYIAAVARAGDVHVHGKPLAQATPVATHRGRDLVGQRYVRPLDVVTLPAEGQRAVVVAGSFVTADEGTGLVHMAPAFGADDYAAGQQYGLAFVNPVAPDGTFQGTRWPEIEGRLVTDKETNRLIIERLKHDGRWLETRPYTHTYPFCWRCDSALIYYARSSWFVRTTAVKARMLEVNRAVDWHPPETGAGRFGEWLENNVDWALSRDRYWGTPLNVWECDREREHREVIGSYEELAQRRGKALPPDFDPHKPSIDADTWPCRDCGGTMRRVPEVIDAWFDSGSMPYAQWHYPFEHQADFKAHFPADYICEGVDQTRGWFYSLLAIGVAVFDSPIYKHVIVNDMLLDERGLKMSKSRGNVVDPWKMLDEHGADAVRLYLCGQSQVWLPKRFDPRQIPEVAGGFLNTLRATYEFFRRYAQTWRPPADAAATPVAHRPAADRWLLARLDEIVTGVRHAWSGYEVTAGVRAIMDFVGEDLSRWYVRRNRPRFWAPDRATDPVALETLHEALVTAARLLAPVAPFIADWLHRALTGTSVHLAPFPVDRGRREPELLQAMGTVRRLASLARAAREARNLRVRQPLARMQMAVPAAAQGPALSDLLDILAAEVNVKAVQVVESDHDLVQLAGKANFRTLGKRYGKDTPRAAVAVSQLTAEQLRALERGEPVAVGEWTFHPEDVTVTREVASDWLVQADGPYVIALDPQLTLDLIQEGLAREVVNRVQRLRKEAGYEYTTRIELSVAGADDVVAATAAFQAFVEGETLARRTVLGAVLDDADLTRDVDIEGRRVTIALRRHDGRKGGTR